MLAQREAPECEADQPASATLRSSCAGPAGEVLGLQRTIGNAAVARMLGSARAGERRDAAHGRARLHRSPTPSPAGHALASAVAARKLMREPATSSGASGALASLTDTIAGHRVKAEAALAGSGLSAPDMARIRRNISFCAESETRLRAIADSGNDAASREVLSAFTQEGINSVLPSLTRVRPVTRVAATEPPDGALATMPWDGPDLTRPAERDAERIAALLVGGRRTLSRRQARRAIARLDSSTAKEAVEVMKPVVPALIAGAPAAGAAIATAPLWVWVALAVVVVVVLVAIAYWVFSDDTKAEPQPQPQPQPVPQPEPQPEPAPEPAPRPAPRPRNPRDECLAQHLGAVVCTDGVDMEEVVQEFLMSQGYNMDALGDCRGMDSFGGGAIDACDGAPGERWHCRVNGSKNEVSVFGCLCCDEEGNSGLDWRAPHWSVNLSKR